MLKVFYHLSNNLIRKYQKRAKSIMKFKNGKITGQKIHFLIVRRLLESRIITLDLKKQVPL